MKKIYVDERIRKAILGLTYIDGIEPILTKCSVTRQDIRAYLEEQGEQKPAWSEEDETIAKALTKAANDNVLYGYIGKSKLLDWLKSLRDRYTWKPSDEQLKSLQEVIDVGYFTSYPNSLETLYEQLKKLR